MDNDQVAPDDIPPVDQALSLETCRLRGLPQVTDSFTGVLTLGLYKRSRAVYETNNAFKVYETSVKTAHRPDLISLLVYGDWQWWWVIMEANDLSGIEEIVPGMTLKIPDLGAIQINLEMSNLTDRDVYA